MTGSPPKVSVIIPHYNDLKSLDLCLAALAARVPVENDVEIIVADNASPCGAEAVAATIAGRARLTVVPEKGAGPARNGGVAVADGDILAFTDSDCVPEPEWLLEGIRALETCDFAGGRMSVLVEDAARMSQAEAFERVFAFDNRDYVLRKGFTVTANLFTTKAVFERVGGFRVGVSEDLEWSHRARAMGCRIGYAAKAVVGHPARRTWEALQGKWRRLDAEMYEFHSEQPGGRFRRLLHSFGLPLSAIAHSPRVFTSDELNSPAQRVAALVMLYRLRLWRFVDTLRLTLRNGSASA